MMKRDVLSVRHHSFLDAMPIHSKLDRCVHPVGKDYNEQKYFTTQKHMERGP